MSLTTDARGKLYEQYLAVRLGLLLVDDRHWQITYGDTRCKMEIKYDRRLHETGNFYIEGAESRKPGGKLIASGPHKACRVYAIGDCSRMLELDPIGLREMLQEAKTKRGLIRTPTSCGVLVAYQILEELCLMEHVWGGEPLACEMPDLGPYFMNYKFPPLRSNENTEQNHLF